MFFRFIYLFYFPILIHLVLSYFKLYPFEESIKVGKELRKDIIVDILELEKLIVDKEVF